MDSIVLTLYRVSSRCLIIAILLLSVIFFAAPSSAAPIYISAGSETLGFQESVLNKKVFLSQSPKPVSEETSKEKKCIVLPVVNITIYCKDVQRKTGRDDTTKSGSRQGWCSNFNLVALLPTVEDVPIQNSKATKQKKQNKLIELTTGEALTLWFYIPAIGDSQKKIAVPPIHYAEFVLLREDGTEVKDLLELPDQSGIAKFPLRPELIKSMTADQPEHWIFSVICDSRRPSRNPNVDGWIQKADSSILNELNSNLEGVKSEEQRIQIYARNKLWYETFNSLIAWHCTSSNDKTLDEVWLVFLGWLHELGINETNISNSFCNPHQTLKLVSSSRN